ncbi:tape measure protein [Bremerella sp. T1]|uniref:tape measure protein n=1 Tax=Bremerella sp. TYQ1 TaxID=3119568 RepID=UPI001CCDBC45|nr:tape measure protein [Bremerella volcania]UBM38375.1 tape measure protein [Bremerella volcania]
MAGTVIANLKIMLSASWAKLKSDFGKASKTVRGFRTQVASSMHDLVSAFGGLGGAAGRLTTQIAMLHAVLAPLEATVAAVVAALALLFAGTMFAGWGVTIAAQAEQAEVAMTTMLGNAQHAKAVMSQVEQFAAETPFQTDVLTKSAKMLAAFQFQAGDIIPTLRMLGDVSALIGAPIDEMAELFGKAKVQGRLFMEDINQFQGRGVPIMQALADVMGVSTEEVRNLVSEGKVGFAELHAAFSSLTSEGGKFHNGMIAQSETLAGLWSTLKDQFSLIAKDIGQDLLPILKELTKYAVAGMRGFRDGVRGVKELLGLDGGKVSIDLPKEDFSKATEGLKQAQESLREGTKEIKKNTLDVAKITSDVQRMQFASPVGAFNRYTTSGFSAVEAAKRASINEEKREIELQKRILDAIKEGNTIALSNRVTVHRRRM